MANTLVNDMRDAIFDIISERLDSIRSQLSEEGVDEDILERVFDGKETTQKKRFLGPNNAQEKHKVTQKRTSKSDKSDEEMTEDFRVKHDGNVVTVCLNYGPKSHALFGNFQEISKSFKDDFLKKQNWIRANSRLKFGFGWVIMDKKKLNDVLKELRKYKINFRQLEKSEYEEEIRSGREKPEEVESSDEEAPVTKTKAPVTKTKAPVTKTKAPVTKTKAPAGKQTRLKAVKNDWGNSEEQLSGFVFKSLPVGPKGKNVPVAIGFQDVDACKKKERGLASICPFDDECKEECKEKSWRFLTEDMVEIIRKTNSKLADSLKDILNAELSDDEEEDDSDEEED